ncbi:MAG TPA: ABC transporter permease [Candidatus Angelobacter sp.]|nr:ABC transporter permease [Candidatus Angelobacter sp.]
MPDWTAEIGKRIASLNLEKAREVNIVEELAQHLEDRYQELLAGGATAEDASRETIDELNDSGLLEHEIFQIERPSPPEPAGRNKRRLGGFVRDFWSDVRYGLRMLYKAPAFTMTAVLTLALGIGANTAIFSVVDSLIFRPLPIKDPDRLTVLAFRQGDGPLLTPFSIADFRDIRNGTTQVFSGMLGYQMGIDGLSVDSKAERLVTNYVTGNYFSELGIKPRLGRLILPSEGETLGANPVIVLSYLYWQKRFGGDPRIVGREVLVNGHPVTVIGVAPQGFYGLYRFVNAQAFLPLGMVTVESVPDDYMVNRIQQNLAVLGHLKPGVDLGTAGSALNVVARRLAEDHPETNKNMSLSVYWEKYSRPDPRFGGILVKASALFVVLVALVLLLACTNVANILIVRATSREREMAIRMALGAARTRLIRQLLTESMVLAFLGGVAGLLLGLWASSASGSINLHTDLPLRLEFGFNWHVFLYAFAAVLITGISVGLWPALRASAGRISIALRESGRSVMAGKHRLRTAFVVLELAGALMLLVMAGLFIRGLNRVQQTDLGFDPENVVNMSMDPAKIGYNGAQGLAYYNDLLRRAQVLPGVDSAALISSVPMAYYNNNDYLKVSGYQNPPGQGPPLVSYSVASPGYFATMRIPLVRGRAFTDRDLNGSPYVAIVNEAFAQRFWPGQDPIGKRFAKVSGITNPTYEIVGVTRNSRFQLLTGPIDPYFYLPLAQNYSLSSEETLQIRSSLGADATVRAVEAIVHDLHPAMPVYGIATMTDSLNNLQGFLAFRFGAAAAAILGGLGLILAVVGVYGVISYSVSQRTQEIGVRVALGAQRGDILRMILRQGARIVALGTLLGLAAAFSVARLAAGLFAGVSSADPLTYSCVTVLLTVVALSACYIPARRAMSVDPMVALHQE